MPFFRSRAVETATASALETGARTAPSCSLDRLETGARGCMLGCSLGPGESSMLAAMGLSVGCAFEVCQGGRSCVVRVGETRIALARELARAVQVQRVA